MTLTSFARWLGLPGALFLLALPSFGAPPLARENQRVAMDASEIRLDFPQLFGAERAGMGLGPQSLAGALVGLPPSALVNGGLRGACERTAADLCYDYADRRMVYRPARQWMPSFEGFTPESVSLRRDAIRFKYSFR